MSENAAHFNVLKKFIWWIWKFVSLWTRLMIYREVIKSSHNHSVLWMINWIMVIIYLQRNMTKKFFGCTINDNEDTGRQLQYCISYGNSDLRATTAILGNYPLCYLGAVHKDVRNFPPIFDPYPPHVCNRLHFKDPSLKRRQQIRNLTPSCLQMSAIGYPLPP